MKKTIILLVLLSLLFGVVACAGGKPATTEAKKAEVAKTEAEKKADAPKAEAPKAEAPKAEAGAKGLKTGMAIALSLAKSKDATDKEDGKLDSYAYVVAVLVGADGKIKECKVDAVISDILFTTTDEIKTKAETTFKSKFELGDGYGMKKASKIGKEWNEQASAFAASLVGKTADEVKKLALKEGRLADADLASKCSIHVNEMQAAVLEAIANAKDLGAKEGDKLGIGIDSSAKGTQAAKDGKPATLQAYNFYTVASFDAKGVITSCVIDSTQAKSTIKGGKLEADLKAPVKTKNAIGEAYGMKKVSKIGKEWNEQAAAFAKYVTGKTVKEVKGIAVSEGKATDKDLASQCSVTITNFIAIIERAATYAK